MRLLSLALISLVLGATAEAADPAVRCESGKLKRAGKYASCLLRADSKGVKNNTTPVYTDCVNNFSEKWQIAESNGMGMCPGGTGDEASIQDYLDDCTQAVADALAGGTLPTCGGGTLPATGQTTSYGAGDDGDAEAGATLAYTDNGDGTITDLNTGLMWERKIDLETGAASCYNETGPCANPHHVHNRYTWSDSDPPGNFDGGIVTIFLEQLNNRCDNDTTVACANDGHCSGVGGACGFAGYQDWRVPNRKELESIVDAGRQVPAIDPAFHGANCGASCTSIGDPACGCTAWSDTWSSTTSAADPKYAWYVYFYIGYVSDGYKGGDTYARAVRGGS
jgi:hypothetical protein